MAQAQGSTQTELEPEDPLEILRAGLMSEQATATEEAALRVADSARNMVVYEGQAQARGNTFAKPAPGSVVITNDSISALYDDVAGTRYVGTMPAGSKVTSKSPNITTKILSDGSVELFVKQVTPEVPPAKVFQAQQEAYSRPQGAVFNLENEEEKIKGLTGEEKLNAITRLLSNLGAEMTKRRQSIGQQAAIQSGYTSAQVALDRALQTEQLPNPQFGGLSFAQRFGVASAQTVQAQEMLRTTQVTMDQLEKSMLSKDSEFSKYAYAQDRILKIEARTAERQARSEAKSDARAEAIAESIPQYQTAAWMALHNIQDPEKANAEIAKAAKNNKPEFIATQSTPHSIYANLMHPELVVRQTTLEVMKNHDKANNAGFENADKLPTTEKVKKYVANPSLLEKDAQQLMPKERIQEFTQQLVAADPKQKISIRQAYHAELLRRAVEKDMENTLGDMRNWRATESSTNTPLGAIIASVSKGTTSGKADLNTVITQFIGSPTFKKPDGSVVPYEERVQILQTALVGAMGNQFKTMLYPDISDLQAKLMTRVTNTAARANVHMRVITVGDPNYFQYQMYSPGKNISNIPQP